MDKFIDIRNSSMVKGRKFIKPSEYILGTYSKKVKMLFLKIENNTNQNQELASLRDWLLPMLMNGQVTVAEAYKEVEEKLAMVAEGESIYSTNKNDVQEN